MHRCRAFHLQVNNVSKEKVSSFALEESLQGSERNAAKCTRIKCVGVKMEMF